MGRTKGKKKSLKWLLYFTLQRNIRAEFSLTLLSSCGLVQQQADHSLPVLQQF